MDRLSGLRFRRLVARRHQNRLELEADPLTDLLERDLVRGILHPDDENVPTRPVSQEERNAAVLLGEAGRHQLDHLGGDPPVADARHPQAELLDQHAHELLLLDRPHRDQGGAEPARPPTLRPEGGGELFRVQESPHNQQLAELERSGHASTCIGRGRRRLNLGRREHGPKPSKEVTFSAVSRTVIVVPTYNEAENLPLIVPELLPLDPGIEVLVVDDASPDGTGKVADDLADRHPGRVHVLHREGARGLGRAYRDGLARALELGADQVIQMDADFSHPPATVKTMLEKLADCDVVLGSRYLKGITVVNWPIERILISWFGNLYARRVTGLPISDATGGFRCTRREWLERIRFQEIRSDGYAFQIEMNYRLVRSGARVEEIPFFFLDRERGESKLSLGIALEALWICPWMRLAGWLGRL